MGARPQRPGGPVGAEDDARGPSLRGDEREFAWRGSIREEAFAFAYEDWIGQEHDFIGEAVFDQHWGEGGAATEDQIRAVL